MSRRFFTRATENPLRPEARGICDRCGMVFDHNALRPQTRQGPGSMKTSLLLVCKSCFDIPLPWMRTLWLPQDPPIIAFPSIEPYSIDASTGPVVVGNFMVDELGAFWIDELGNNMATETSGGPVPINNQMVDEAGNFWVDELGSQMVTI